MGLLSTLAQAWTVQRAVRDQARYHRAVRDPQRTQHEWLLAQLRREQETVFGRDHRFAEIRSVDDFRRHVPIGSYESHEPYIERVKQGETQALFHRQRVRMFALTSGTTSARKFIPVTDSVLDNYRRVWTVWGLLAYAPRPALFRHARLTLVSDWDEFRTPAGIPCGSISGFTAQLQSWVVRQGYVLPPESGKLSSTEAKYYLAWRLGSMRSIGSWISPNPSTLLQLARYGEEHTDELLRDLRDGTLTDRFDWPKPLQPAIERQIRPQPQRVRELEQVLQRTGGLKPKDVWPQLKLLGCWTGGSMGVYLRSFPEYFGDAAIRDLGLIASEGRMTFPIEDHTSSGVLEIVSGFYEFIPINEMESPQPTVLQAHELQEGADYYILLTTASGLYRYNIWDVVRCTGWFEKTPLLAFLHKGTGISSVTGEKLTEYQATVAMAEALAECDIQFEAFALSPGWEGDQPYYALLVESSDVPDEATAETLAEVVDRRLQVGNIEYAAKRKSQRLGPLRPMLLPEGFWQRWDEQQRQKTGGSREQFKRRVLLTELPLQLV